MTPNGGNRRRTVEHHETADAPDTAVTSADGAGPATADVDIALRGVQPYVPPEQQPGFALYTATNALVRACQPLLAQIGLTFPEYMTLVALWDRDGVTVGNLANRLATPVSGLSTLLGRLEKAGIIVRHRDQQDRRNVTVTLTDNGRALEVQAEAVDAAAHTCLALNIDVLTTLRRKARPGPTPRTRTTETKAKPDR